MIILRKAKYGTGYRDLGHVARISTTLLYVPSLYTVCLLNMTYVQVHYNLRFYWWSKDSRPVCVCVI